MLLISLGAEDTKLAGPVRLPGLRGPEGALGDGRGVWGWGGSLTLSPRTAAQSRLRAKAEPSEPGSNISRGGGARRLLPPLLGPEPLPLPRLVSSLSVPASSHWHPPKPILTWGCLHFCPNGGSLPTWQLGGKLSNHTRQSFPLCGSPDLASLPPPSTTFPICNSACSPFSASSHSPAPLPPGSPHGLQRDPSTHVSVPPSRTPRGWRAVRKGQCTGITLGHLKACPGPPFPHQEEKGPDPAPEAGALPS